MTSSPFARRAGENHGFSRQNESYTVTFVLVHLTRRGALSLAVVAAGLLALNPALFWWSMAGTESPLQALLVTLAFLPLLPVQRGPAPST